MAWLDYKKVNHTVPHTCMIEYLNMYKIFDKVIKFIMETMKNWKVELTAAEKLLAEVKIQWGIFQGGALSPLLFQVATSPLNNKLRKCTGSYRFTKSLEKINHLMYMDDIKPLAKKWKRNGHSDTNNKNIQRGYRNVIWHRKMSHAHNEKWNINNRKNRIARSKKNQNV